MFHEGGQIDKDSRVPPDKCIIKDDLNVCIGGSEEEGFPSFSGELTGIYRVIFVN